MASSLSFGSRLLISIIRGYQLIISPLLGPRCRFNPTCSQYGIEVLYRFGLIKGGWLMMKRVLKCHPYIEVVTIPFHLDRMTIIENINDGFATQSFIHRLAICFVLIWQTWESDKTQPIKTDQIVKQMDMPSHDDQANLGHEQAKFITVKTDVLELRINTRGGDIDGADLLLYPKELHSSDPFRLLETSKDFIYQAQSGLIGQDGPDNPGYNNGLRPLYLSTATSYALQDGQDELRVPLTFTGKDGVVYQKVYVLKRGKYNISVEYNIDNKSAKPLSLAFLVN